LNNSKFSKTIKELLMISSITALLGQIYIFPFGTTFRVGLGVVAFVVLILYFSEIDAFLASIFTAIVVFGFRVLLDLVFNHYRLEYALLHHFPGGIYYIIFGTIFERMYFQKLLDKPIYFIIYLGLIDTFSNSVEIFVRILATREIPLESFDDTLSLITAIGFGRSFITWNLYWGIQKYTSRVLEKEQQKRYLRLLILSSNIKNELYFLKKSAEKIENVMKKSYEIYSLLANNDRIESIKEELKQTSLELAIDMHEIKKDYFQLKGRMEKLIPPIELSEFMHIKEILEVLKELSMEYAASIGKKIDIFVNCEIDFLTDKYSYFFPIFNEMIYNAIEAIGGKNGIIELKVFKDRETIIFEVKDNGKGIQAKNLNAIFEPGFTTKFDEKTGEISTGLGLYQVKKLVELLKGEITVTSVPEVGTTFTIKIPKETIVVERGESKNAIKRNHFLHCR